MLNKQDSESRAEYNHYLEKRGFDTTYSYQLDGKNCVDSLSAENYAINVWKIEHDDQASPVQFRRYDRKGQFINGWEICYGKLSYFNFFDTIPFRKIKILPTNTLISLKTDLNLVNISNREALLNEITNNDYIITVYYAKWAGYYSRNTLREIKKYYNTYKGSYKILLIFVNTMP